MFFDNIFSEHIKILRTSHCLSLAQFADLLAKKKAAIAQVEAGRNTTTLESLFDIANLYAVSADWLIGRSDIAYQPDILSRLEHDLRQFASPSNINLAKNTDYIYFYYTYHFHLHGDQYFSSAEKYLPAQRANVIFSLNVFKYASVRLHNEGFNAQEMPIETVLKQLLSTPEHIDNDSLFDKIKNSFQSKRAGSNFAVLLNNCLDCLQYAHLHYDHSDKIFFNIENHCNYPHKKTPDE